MIATIVADAGGLKKVAGLSLVGRLVCAMGRAGVSDVRVEAPPDISDRIEAALEGDGCSDYELGVKGSAPPASKASSATGEQEPSEFELTVDSNVVLDGVFLKDLFSRIADRRATAPLRVAGGLRVDLPAARLEGAATTEEVAELSADELAGTYVEVRSSADARRAKRELIRACRKPLDIDGLICRLLGRPISGWISYVLVELPVRPNAVTGLSLALGLAGSGVAAVGGYLPFLVGAGLLFFSWVLDNCDGEIARVKYQGSRWGAWFDIYADFVTNIAFIAAMGIGAYRYYGHWVYLVVGAYVVAAMSIYNGVVFRHIHKLGVPDEFLFEWWFDREDPKADGDQGESERAPSSAVSSKTPAGSLVSRTFSYVKYLGRRDFFIFAYFVAAAFDVLVWALWATAVGATYSLILTIFHLAATKGE
jgi:hypothetical protein